MTADGPPPFSPSPTGGPETGTGTVFLSYGLPLLVWLIPQLVALFVSAGRVAFSPRLDAPFEGYAPQLLLGVQIAVASLLCPYLFRDRASAIAVTLTAPPLLLFAGLLAGAPLSSTAWAGGYVVMYLIAVALALRAPHVHPRYLQLALATLVLAGPLLVYLHAEAGAGPDRFAACARALTPLTGALSVFSGNSRALALVFPPLLVLAAHGIARLLGKALG